MKLNERRNSGTKLKREFLDSSGFSTDGSVNFASKGIRHGRRRQWLACGGTHRMMLLRILLSFVLFWLCDTLNCEDAASMHLEVSEGDDG